MQTKLDVPGLRGLHRHSGPAAAAEHAGHAGGTAGSGDESKANICLLERRLAARQQVGARQAGSKAGCRSGVRRPYRGGPDQSVPARGPAWCLRYRPWVMTTWLRRKFSLVRCMIVFGTAGTTFA